MTKIAMLGFGAMGSRIAQNLLKAQHSVIVYNRTSEKVIDQGLMYAATPKAAAEQAEIVISMVTDDEASRHVWLSPQTGAIWGLRPETIAIESSTVTVNWVKELASKITQQGSEFLDAPVVGSLPQAEAGKLIYLVGGHEATLDRIRSVLASTGSAQFVGGTAQGMAMKLAVNALFGIQVAALGEIIGILGKNGIDPTRAMECLGELPVISPAAKGAGSLIAANRHTPMFPIQLVEKDFRYMLQTAQMLGANSPISHAIHDVYETAIAQGYGNDNISGVAQLFDR